MLALDASDDGLGYFLLAPETVNRSAICQYDPTNLLNRSRSPTSLLTVMPR